MGLEVVVARAMDDNEVAEDGMDYAGRDTMSN
jgi:hypothetical protein